MSQLCIGVIGGTGSEGRGLALRFARAGARVVLGSRAVDRARAAVEAMGRRSPELHIEPDDNAGAIAASDIVFLAVPFAHASALLEAHHDAFRPGSLLIDVTVPVSFERGAPQLVDVPEGSAAEQVRRCLPSAVRLAAALKIVPARLLEQIERPLDCDDFVCGDSEEARSRATHLLGLLPGLRPLDVGPLDAARIIERMTLLAISINRRYKIHDARYRVVGL